MKQKNLILILIFGIILISPLVSGIFKIGDNIVLKENRLLAKMPKLGMYEDFPQLFTKYFNDHVGLRSWFILADRWMRYEFFGTSPNKSVTIGKDSWLYYTPDINYIDSLNAQAFTEGELAQIKANILEVQDMFNKKGIKFYFLLAPNKQSIYPEFLPGYMKKIREDSRLDQLSLFLEKDGRVNFINPKNELIEMKKTNPVYLKYDTHWNELGAYVGYQKLFNKIKIDFKNIKAKNINDFVISETETPNNDLATQLGVMGKFKEKGQVFENKSEVAKIVYEKCPDKYIECPVTIRQIDNPKLLKLVMFRDSFGVNLIPLVEEHFQRSYFYWGSIPYPMAIIEKEKPDMVIMELTERELWRLKDKLFSESST